MSNTDFTAIANATNECVRLIVEDIEGRSGLGDAWEDIDKRTKRDIRNDWASIIVTQFSGLTKPHPGNEDLERLKESYRIDLEGYQRRIAHLSEQLEKERDKNAQLGVQKLANLELAGAYRKLLSYKVEYDIVQGMWDLFVFEFYKQDLIPEYLRNEDMWVIRLPPHISSVDYRPEAPKAFIVLDDPWDRIAQVFTLAHEIGHVISFAELETEDYTEYRKVRDDYAQQKGVVMHSSDKELILAAERDAWRFGKELLRQVYNSNQYHSHYLDIVNEYYDAYSLHFVHSYTGIIVANP
jgi:hypothetical protein